MLRKDHFLISFGGGLMSTCGALLSVKLAGQGVASLWFAGFAVGLVLLVLSPVPGLYRRVVNLEKAARSGAASAQTADAPDTARTADAERLL